MDTLIKVAIVGGTLVVLGTYTYCVFQTGTLNPITNLFSCGIGSIGSAVESAIDDFQSNEIFSFSGYNLAKNWFGGASEEDKEYWKKKCSKKSGAEKWSCAVNGGVRLGLGL